MAKWLILDVCYLAHRAHHTTGSLSFNNKATGIIYGLLRDIHELSYEFRTRRIAFCFDSRHSNRRSVYPEYKRNRLEKRQQESGEEKQKRADFDAQLKLLRTEVLPELGFSNIFCQRGLEADDLIAKITLDTLTVSDRVTIVSSDQDLYQLLGVNVKMYKATTKREYTFEMFKNEFGIFPVRWPEVKAIAGCSSDNIQGIQGIGVKTACRFIRNELKVKSPTEDKIINGTAIIARNMPLVQLPFTGTKEIRLHRDELSKKRWRRIIKRFGFQSLATKIPYGLKDAS